MSRVLASSFDRVFARLVLRRGGRTAAEKLGPDERLARLHELSSIYDQEPYLLQPERFFPTPPCPDVRRTVRSTDGQTEVLDLQWDSGYQPFSDAVSDEYSRRARNRIAHGRWFKPRRRHLPVVILLHGYLGGAHTFEQRIWPVRWFLKKGLSVVLAVLPFHGLRKGLVEKPSFPGSDPRVTIEGFRQTVHDLRGLLYWLKKKGAPKVGAMGMSLGAYSASLLATVEAELDFVVPFIPLASIPDFARDRGRLTGTQEAQRAQHRLLESVYRVVSPLSRPALVEHALVVAGENDRITPAGGHARQLATHFRAPLELFSGGHLLQYGRRGGFKAIERLLKETGVIESGVIGSE